LFRVKWNIIRHYIENPPTRTQIGNFIYEVCKESLEEKYQCLDDQYLEKFPRRTPEEYVPREGMIALKSARKKLRSE
jgi:hypothetical protein